jgi:UDP-MurNAc hydroxylase
LRFTVVGHSCLYFETAAGSILVDPWLAGSCYWRSWWHYPPSSSPTPELLAPDYIYLTHHHFDHFHYPSMRRLAKRAQVLIPRFGVDVMVDEVRDLGFENVRELPHGKVVDLGHDVRVASFQYGFDDTSFVVADGPDVVVDINDSKIRGRSLRRMKKAFGAPTFAMKGWSFAQSYPIGYTADDPADLELVSRQSFLDDWVGRIEDLEPRYAVPFGSMMALLHPETRDLNRHFIPPSDVVATWKRSPAGSTGTTEAVAMAPGDAWSSETGFELGTTDWYTDREQRLERIVAEIQPRLDEQAAAEAGRTVDFDVFSRYFRRFARALPPFVGRLAIRRPIVFLVPSSAEPYWTIDVRRKRVERGTQLPPDTADLIRVPEAVLAEAIEHRVMHVVHGSFRIRTELRPGGVSADLAFWGLLVPWELGYLSWRTILRPRFWRVLWRRRAELIDTALALRGRGSLAERMSGRLSEQGDDREDHPAKVAS